MRRNCNLELTLFSPSSSDSNHHHHHLHHQEEDQLQQKLTIFYNGRVCVSDVTELQARAIIMLASRETEEKSKTPSGSTPASPTLQSQQLYCPVGLSMKRSLQGFLQKRRHRIQATAPYSIDRCLRC